MDSDKPHAPEPLWGVKEAAVFLRTTAHSIYKLVERKQIPHLRFGRRIRFDPAKLREWLATLEIRGTK